MIRKAIKALLYPIYEARLLRKLDFSQTPQHVGVILDGNRRWAKANPELTSGGLAKHGHQAGADKILEFLNWCEAANVKVVTLWLLSTDNFKRSSEELDTLLEIIGSTVDSLVAENKWKLKAVGALDILPPWLQSKLKNLPNLSSSASADLEVNVAIGYGGRREIVDAIKSYLQDANAKGLSIEKATEQLSDLSISENLYTAGQPDPELLIRTSGEQRLGGFLLWQSAQSEFYFCEAYWPDFRRVDFLRALRSYSIRHRRFGK